VIALAGTGDRHRPERAIGMAGTRRRPRARVFEAFTDSKTQQNLREIR
jgi:hypothetical protein